MKSKLFVSNLDFDVTTEDLEEEFKNVGACISCVIATDKETKRSKGFAFVEMGDADAAKQAIEALNGKSLNGRPIKVVEDRGKGGGADSSGSRQGGERRKREHLPPIQRMQLFRRPRKLDPFVEDPSKSVDYKDVALLSRFVSERGKILSRKLTGLNAYNQRKVAKAVKRAQSLGLLPFTR